jgi:hypothetical protein
MPHREQMRPASKKHAPDPARSYERARPENEAGMGRLDNDVATPTRKPEQTRQTVKNRRDQSKGRRSRP